MKEQTDYEIEKQAKKQKLVRNEFLYHNNSAGKYEFPIIRKQNINVEEIEFLSFVNTKIDDEENKNKTIHFFTYDWLFEKVYEKADENFERLKQYKYLLSPDFSIFTNMPLALQIESVFKNRWCGAYWQSRGLKVIPTVSWGDERSFHFCFDGIEEGSVVAVCTYYRECDEMSFMLGYNEMMRRIKPSVVICYDEPFKGMTGNIKEFLPTTYEWTKDLSWKDLAQFKWEKKNRKVSGLNKRDFKYFEYDDPYAKTKVKKCDVCGNVCFVDNFGNGVCEHCSWDQGAMCKDDINYCGYPNLISLARARELYKIKKPFVPNFTDFVQDLLCYGEMEFTYKNVKYIAIRYTDYFEIVFFKEGDRLKQGYKSVEEFEEKCNINGKRLKDIWNDVSNVDYLS